MSKIRLNSNNSLVIIGKSPSFKDYNETGDLFGGVTNSSFSVSLERETLGAVGSKELSVNNINKQPNIDLSIDYLYNPLLVNELSMGLSIATGVNFKATGLISSLSENSYNFYFYNHPKEGQDAIQYFKSSDLLTPNSGEIFSFGNAYLKSYGISFENSSVPKVTTTYSCSNMQGDVYSGNIKSPAINLKSGNANNVGSLVVSGTNLSGYSSDYQKYLDFTNPDINAPGCGFSFDLANIQIGGQNLEGADHRIKSMSLNIPITRVDLEGLGSDYIYGRKIQFPLRGTLNIESDVSNYQTGFISGLLAEEKDYSFSLIAKNIDADYASVIRFKKVLLESFSYSMPVNEVMKYSSSFSFPINNEKDLNFWSTPFFDSTVRDSNGSIIRSTSLDIPSYWSVGDLTAANLKVGTAANSIGREAFSGCSNISGNLTIPDFTETIGRAAFKECSSLNGDLYLPDSLVDVKYQTFYNCSGFDGSLYIGETISSIAQQSFFSCTGLNGDLNIPNTVQSIGSEAFANCLGFKDSITISNKNVTSIGSNAFSGCEFNELILDSDLELTNNEDFDYFSDREVLLTFPTYMSGINDNSFDNYKITGSLLLPQFLEKIGKRAFYNNTGLNGFLLIDEGVSLIDDEAFYNCNNITGSLILPDSLTGLGNYSFADCGGFINQLDLPSKLIEIQSGTFSGCFGLTGDITLSNKIKKVESAAFFGCSGLNGKITVIGNKEIAIDAFENNKFKNITINKVATINNNDFDAFKNSFLSLTLGNETKQIKEKSFDGYNFTGSLNLNNVNLIGDNAFSGSSFDGDLYIGEKITGLGSGAFQNSSSFNGTLSISGQIDEIKEKTFYGCSSFNNELKIPSNINNIKNGAFSFCSGFNSLEIEDGGVTGIGDFSFNDCIGFQSLNLNSGLLYIGKNAFEDCSGFTGSLVIPDTVSFMDDFSFHDCRNFEKLDLGCGVTGLGFAAISGATGLKSFGAGGQLIATPAQFSGQDWNNLVVKGCNEIPYAQDDYFYYKPYAKQSTLTLEEGIKYISEDAFNASPSTNLVFSRWGFTGNLKIPNTCTGIGEEAFYFGQYQGIDLGTGLEHTDTRCFSLTRNLRGSGAHLKIPNSLKKVGEYSFENSSYQTLDLGEGVEEIDRYAFRGTSSSPVITRFTGGLVIPRSLRRTNETQGNNGCFLITNWFWVQPGYNRQKFVLPRDNNLEFIGGGTFSNFVQSKGMIVDDDGLYLPKVEEIRQGSFNNCSAYAGKKLVISDSCVDIQSLAFQFCKFSGSLEVPKYCEFVGQGSFSNVAANSSVPVSGGFDGSLKIRPGYSYFENPSFPSDTQFYRTSPNYPFRGNKFNELIVPNYVTGIIGYQTGLFSTVDRGYNFYNDGPDCKYNGTGGAFSHESILTFESPATITDIGFLAFATHGYTGALNLPDSLTGVGHKAFINCSGFSSLSLKSGSFQYKSGEASIKSGVFEDCYNIKKVETFPNRWVGGLEPGSGSGYIHPLAFSGCDIERLVISEDIFNVKSGDYDFYLNHLQKTSLGFDYALNSIGDSSFSNWPLTGDLNLNLVSIVSNNSFSGCSGLSGKLSIGNATEVGTAAFNSCPFSGVFISGGELKTSEDAIRIKKDDYLVFENEVKTLSLNGSCLDIDSGAFSGYNFRSRGLSFPDSITGIGIKAFANCSGISGDLKMGCNINQIGKNAFSGCKFSGSLTYGSNALIGDGLFDGSYFKELIVPGCIDYLNVDAFDFYKDNGFDSNSILNFEEGVSGTLGPTFKDFGFTGSLVLPESFAVIGSGSFQNCSGFSGSLNFENNNSMLSIGSDAFNGCTGLDGGLTFNDNIALIGDRSFVNLENISGNLTLPNNISEVGVSAFEGCSSLGPDLSFGETTLYIRNSAFKNCVGIQNFTFFDSSLVREINASAFDGCTGIVGDLITPASLAQVGDFAFRGCSGIGSIYLDVNRNKISSTAFANGPTGYLYVTDIYSGTYPPIYNGMEVREWIV